MLKSDYKCVYHVVRPPPHTQGGFAHCYELIDEAGTVYAGKIVPKSLLTKPHQKQKMAMEIEVHKALSHPHVVGFSGFFEDKEHVYILLELCRRRSLMELHKRRRALTEPEVRYFISQILDAVLYLHREKVCVFEYLFNILTPPLLGSGNPSRPQAG